MNKPASPKILAVIPARYASTRFPGKPLVEIVGKPMIQHVWERVRKVPSIDEVVVATDDQRILEAVEKFGGHAVLTGSDHQTGTDRIVEVASGKFAPEVSVCEWVLNVQGDEPLISPDDLECLIQKAKSTENTKVATLVFQITDETKLNDPNVVKVVLNQNGQALYFSRSPIPFHPHRQPSTAWRHLGVYLFRRDFLLQFHQWPQTPLERLEQLEQLRILENGETLLCVEAESDGVGVDVPEDVSQVEANLRRS